jgi:hypothetical protein
VTLLNPETHHLPGLTAEIGPLADETLSPEAAAEVLAILRRLADEREEEAAA